ncbi:MAG: FMN-binding protein [Polaribacter sp.]|nr:FMN-binding protein [Polaribacter sp.]
MKKVKKVIEKTFEIKGFVLKPIFIDTTTQATLLKPIEKEQLFKIVHNKTLVGYAFVDKAPSKTDIFDYLILLDIDLAIAKAKVLTYREDYGSEIGSRRWLKQFIGKGFEDRFKYGNQIMAISGATISAHSMTRAINAFLKNLKILHKNNIL